MYDLSSLLFDHTKKKKKSKYFLTTSAVTRFPGKLMYQNSHKDFKYDSRYSKIFVFLGNKFTFRVTVTLKKCGSLIRLYLGLI